VHGTGEKSCRRLVEETLRGCQNLRFVDFVGFVRTRSFLFRTKHIKGRKVSVTAQEFVQILSRPGDADDP
jgi:hypothetical protein